MKKYLVKEVSVATDKNRTYPMGHEVISIHGKEMIKIEGGIWGDFDFGEWGIRKYGYSRKCDAVRNWSYKNPENTAYWQSTVEIIEVNVG